MITYSAHGWIKTRSAAASSPADQHAISIPSAHAMRGVKPPKARETSARTKHASRLNRRRLRNALEELRLPLLAGFIAWFLSAAGSCEPQCAFVSRDVSPDGRFEVVLCRLPNLATNPGGGSDAPGWIRLNETATGKTLRRTKIAMIQLMEDVVWSSDRVYIKLIADWELPP